MCLPIGIAFLYFCQQDLMGDERWGNAGQLSLLCGQPPVLAANILMVAVAVWGKSWGEPLDRIQSLCYQYGGPERLGTETH